MARGAQLVPRRFPFPLHFPSHAFLLGVRPIARLVGAVGVLFPLSLRTAVFPLRLPLAFPFPFPCLTVRCACCLQWQL